MLRLGAAIRPDVVATRSLLITVTRSRGRKRKTHLKRVSRRLSLFDSFVRDCVLPLIHHPPSPRISPLCVCLPLPRNLLLLPEVPSVSQAGKAGFDSSPKGFDRANLFISTPVSVSTFRVSTLFPWRRIRDTGIGRGQSQ